MKETYVKLKQSSEQSGIDTYCPIDIEKHQLVIGLSLIGFVPKDAEIIGEFDEETNKLTLQKKRGKSGVEGGIRT
jgi:hypothetical protein